MDASLFRYSFVNQPGVAATSNDCGNVMRTRPIGQSGKRVTQIGLGTWPLAGDAGIGGYGPVDPASAEETVRAALSAGITLFETANVYGDGFAEDLLGRLVPDDNGRYLICTKGGFGQFDRMDNFHPDGLEKECLESRERLRRETVDIYLVHNPPPQMIGLPDLYRPLLRLKERGYISHIGVSVRLVQDAWLALDRPEVEVIQLPFNLLQTDAEQGLLHRAYQQGKGVFARETLANGILSGHYSPKSMFGEGDFRQDLPDHIWKAVQQAHSVYDRYRRTGENWVDFALRYVLDRPEISSAVVGSRKPEHIASLVKAGAISSSPVSS